MKYPVLWIVGGMLAIVAWVNRRPTIDLRPLLNPANSPLLSGLVDLETWEHGPDAADGGTPL